jgi:hypothetical protein
LSFPLTDLAVSEWDMLRLGLDAGNDIAQFSEGAIDRRGFLERLAGHLTLVHALLQQRSARPSQATNQHNNEETCEQMTAATVCLGSELVS